jgi:hypothetical protein
MRVIQAIRLAQVPKPTIVAMIDGLLGISWGNGRQLATIVQIPGLPAQFGCQTFVRLKPVSNMMVDLDELDGPARLMEFLDAVGEWLE